MKKSVLFLCTGNSARSQLAHGLFRHMAGEEFDVYSAGVNPSEIDPRVFEVLGEEGIACSDLSSKSTDLYRGSHFDFVITLCESAKDECGILGDTDAQMHWDFFDPKLCDGVEPFREVFKGLRERISLFLLLNGEAGEDSYAPTMLFKLMSDPLRLKILMLLEDEQLLSVSDLTTALGESQPKVSRHLALLRDSGFLQDIRDGLWIFYRLTEHLPVWIRHTLQTVRNGNPGIINQEKTNLKNTGRKHKFSKKL